jgi:hypothetical protein
MATKDTRKHLEAIMGQELSEDAFQLIQLIQPVATTTDGRGMTADMHLLIPRKTCHHNRLLDVGGFAQTGISGQTTLLLKSFICLPEPETLTFLQPINVVATPLSTKPFFLTVTRVLVNNGADVEIKVFSWDANGAPAPNISFDWRCRVELLLRFL